ncbi:unnamed protein product [Pylaiella littoralis]
MDNPLATNVDITAYLVEFVHDKQYLYFASVSRGWRDAWGQKRPAVTTAVIVDTSVSQLLCSIACGLGRTTAVCTAISTLVRLDLLQCARENDYPWDWMTCSTAAKGGHIDVLK